LKTIILISGKMQSGKNVVAKFIEEFMNDKTSVEQLYFAKNLKDYCKNDFKKIVDYMNSFIDNIKTKYESIIPNILFEEIGKLRIEDENFYENKTEFTRLLLQIYGTEIFRDRVDKNYWVNKVAENIKNSDSKYILITDVRFPNEITHLSKSLNNTKNDELYKIITLRVNRDLDRNSIIHEHESESRLDDYNFDYVINNNGSLEELKNITIDFLNDVEN